MEDLIDNQQKSESQKKRKSSNLVIVNDPYSEKINKEELYRELDQNRPYDCNQEGILEEVSFCKLHRIIHTYGYQAFIPCRDILMEER